MISSYGSGNKPLIRSSAQAVVSLQNEGGWIISGLDIECTTTNPLVNSQPINRGIVVSYNSEGTWSNLVIEGNRVRGPGINSNSEGILISAEYPTGKHNEVARNIVIRDNEIYNLGWRAIGTGGWDTALSDNLKSSALFYNVKVLNNTAYQLGNQGIVIGNSNHGSIKWNVVHDGGQYTGTGVTWGPGGIWPVASSYMDVMFNEVYNMSDSNTGFDGSGLNIDWSNEYINLQYNYAHDNKGNGITTMANINSRITNNIVKGNRGESSIGVGQIAISDFTVDTGRYSGTKNLVVENNLIVVNKGNTSAINSSDSSTGDDWSGNIVRNNQIVLANGVAGTKSYVIGTGAGIDTINSNRIYSGSGTAFEASRFGTGYSSLAAWRTATGLDMDTVLSVLDTTAPTAPSGGAAAWNGGLNGISLNWSGATDSGSGLSHYNIYRSTSSSFVPSYRNMVGEAETASFVDKQELQSGTTYYYKIEAEDRNGNGSTGYATANATSGTVVVAPKKYDASKDFGIIAQGPVWEYEKGAGSTYTKLNGTYAPWRMWRDGTAYLGVGENVQAPDGNDAIRTWIAPEDGQIALNAASAIQIFNSGSGADGVRVKVMKNNTQIWPSSGWQTVVYGAPVSSPNMTLNVVKGDKIRFVANQNGNGLYDTVLWDPSVQYLQTNLLHDDFELGAAGRWSALSGSWSVVTDGASQKLKQTGNAAGLSTAGSASWSNYRMISDVKITSSGSGGGFANLIFRLKDANNKYFVYLSDTQGLAIKKTVAGVQTELASKAVAIGLNTTYHVEVVVSGNQIELYVDNILQLSAADGAVTFTKGQIGLETYQATVLFDNVQVIEL